MVEKIEEWVKKGSNTIEDLIDNEGKTSFEEVRNR